MKNGMEYYWDENSNCWRNTINNGRMCTTDNEVLETVLDNCKESLTRKNKIHFQDVVSLMEKALEGVANSKDLTSAEHLSLKTLRNMIKGL